MNTDIEKIAADLLKKIGDQLVKSGQDPELIKRQLRTYVDHCTVSSRSARDLQKCTAASHTKAMRHCIDLGLWPGPAGHIFIIPREVGKENGKKGTGTWVANAQVGYKGVAHLLRSHGIVEMLQTSLVYRGEPFRLIRTHELDDFHHGTVLGRDHDIIVGAYAIATLPNGLRQVEAMDVRDIERIRQAHGNAKVWGAHFGEMARKTVLARLAKHLGTSDELARAIQLVHELDGSSREPRNVTPRRPAVKPAALLERAATYAETEEQPAAQTVEA